MGAAQSNEHTQKLQLHQQQFQHLIPGLPNEIAMECLVRVPYQFHSDMKSVCQSWRSLISHPSFYQQRRRSSTAEHLVCLVQPLPSPPSSPPTPPYPKIEEINNNAAAKKEEEERRQREGKQIQSPPVYGVSIYNATHQTWHRTSWPNSATLPMFCQCVALPSSGKLLVLGGWDLSTLEPVPNVYVLDLIGGGGGGGGCCWRRGAPMSVARSFFACAVVGPSTVYVAGGHDNQKNALRSAEVYDVDKDEWRTVAAMAEERDECQGMSWVGDSKFWVVSGYGTDSQGRFRSDAECYDPAAGSWSTVHGVWPFSTTSPRGTTTTTVTAGNQQQWWWFLGAEQQQQQQQQQQEDDDKERRWKVVSSIPIPNSMIGTSTSVCVVNLETGIKDCNEHHDQHRIFVMGGSGGRGASTCVECEGEGAFILDKDNVSGKTKWNHIHTPPGFSAFPFSASYLQI